MTKKYKVGTQKQLPSFEMLIYCGQHEKPGGVRRVLFAQVGENPKGESIWTATYLERVHDYPVKEK